ncbi:MAG: epoxyqueuosine reductase QueH [Candidatus Omnitrophota bacterium]|nr:epoxyqueuosine reductase QueH [Candidatus Omnitrophota bacterium]
MDILLHICCGPCLIYPFGRLKKEGFNIKGFYYNPNIYPREEYNSRKGSVELLSKDLDFDVEMAEYDDSDFFQATNVFKNTPERCLICWSLRLRKTAEYAKKNNLFLFSTTLLVSPYQDHAMLKQLGDKIAKETGIDFYYEDFRPGFRQAYKEARQKGLYLQKYCGCKYSIKQEASGVK